MKPEFTKAYEAAKKLAETWTYQDVSALRESASFAVIVDMYLELQLAQTAVEIACACHDTFLPEEAFEQARREIAEARRQG